MARNHIREFYEAGGYVKPKESREQKRRRIDQALYGASQWGRPKMADGGRIGFSERGAVTALMKRIAGSQGRAAGRRVEQAADSVDLSRYMPSALDEVFDKRNPGLLTTMRPSEFEDYAYPLPQRWINQTPYRGSGAEYLNFKGNYNDYIKSLKDVAEGGGFEQTPALWFGQNKAKSFDDDYRLVIGHDGRHRMRALAEMGDEPTLVNLLPQQQGMLGRTTATRRITPSWFGDGLFPEVLPQTYLPYDKNTWNTIELPNDLFASGGRVGFAGGGAAARMLRAFKDAPSKWIDDWKWRPVADVAKEMPTKLPEHIEGYGRFMQDMANIAGTEGLSPRDLQKAYLTTRMSMQRQAISPEILKRAGLDVPMDQGLVRPEGAMSRFFGMPIGEKYLEQAGKGAVDPKVIEDASGMFRNFGKTEDARDMFEWAPRLAGQEGRTSELVDRAARGQGDPQEWVDHMLGIRGISPAKHGFYGSLLGYGDRPTLDARQIQLWTGQPTSESTRWTSKPYKAVEGVDRLAARQRALGMEMPEGLDPFYQHLTHHALWDTFGGDVTTHQDLIDSMLGRAKGGRIGFKSVGSVLKGLFKAGKEENLVERAATMRGETPEETARLLERTKEGVKGATETSPGLSKRMGTAPYMNTTASVEPSPFQTPSRILTPESFPIGSYVVGGMADLSGAGPTIHSVNQIPFTNPIQLRGGVDFPYMQAHYGHPGELWAAAKGALSGMGNAARKAGAGPNDPVFFMNKGMGLGGADQSNMAMEMLHQMMQGTKLSEGDAKTLDAYIRNFKTSLPGKSDVPGKMKSEYRAALPDFPGVNSPELHDYLMGLPMGQRATILKALDTKIAGDLGAPNPASVRLALTDPAQMGVPRGAVGRTIGQFDLDAPFITDPGLPHPSYPVHLPGTVQGGFDRPMPGSMMFKDRWDQLRSEFPGKPDLQMTKFMTFPAVQRVTPEWQDEAMRQFEALKKGWSPSGLAHGGRTAFGRGGSVRDRERYHVSQWQEPWS